MIEEQSTYFKLQLKTISEELKQAKDIISDLKGQLRQVQKDVNDNIKDPRHHSTKSVSSQTITNNILDKKPTQLLTDNLINTQIVETIDDYVTDIPKSPVIAKSSNNIYSLSPGFWQSFISIEVCRDCIPALASSCKKQLTGFFVCLLFFLKVKRIS